MLKHAARLFVLVLLASLCLPFSGFCRDNQVTFLYTTDTHGRLNAASDIIGMDTIAALKKRTPNALLVDAGDYLQGNPLVNLNQGKNAVELMKLAGYDAAALGNHEFDFGLEPLRARMAEAAALPNPMAMLCANVLKADGTPFAVPWTVFTVNGLKIGVFGLTTEDTAVQTNPKNVAGLTFAEVEASARKAVESLRAQGCDVVIALTHVGTEGVIGTKSTDIAARVSGLDVVIDGHSHVVVDQTMPNGTIVVSSGAHARQVGSLTITRVGGPGSGLEKKNVFLKKADLAAVAPDPAITDLVAGMRAAQDVQLKEVVGFADADLEAERTIIRAQETNFGDLCADALLHMTKADIAIVNGGGIRHSIKKGPITKGDVIAAIPFADAVITKEVTGKQLMEILEFALRGLPNENGGFPQVGGLHLIVDAAKPAGDRIVAISQSNGTPISLQKTYVLAVTDFLSQGGDGYPVLASLPAIKLWMGPDAALIEFLREKGTSGYTGLAKPRLELRNLPKDDKRSEGARKPVWRYGAAG